MVIVCKINRQCASYNEMSVQIYIYRVTAVRIDHTQLTAKMITNVIREDVEKDHYIVVKQVRALVNKIYPKVNLKYNKL
jgi:phenylpyruvate tautomerase PptA (4-oxalocrotonate tautomerase family)